jgi:Cu/Ag efflux protein CusF
MNRSTRLGVAVPALVAFTCAAAAAQVSKTLTGETRSMSATVETIESSTRAVTVKKSNGEYEVLYCPPTLKRCDSLKIGDKINAKYYETVVLRLKLPGEADQNTASAARVPAEQAAAGTISRQRTITATISAIDPKVPSISFVGPQGWKYSSRVQDKDALAKVKVGDKIDITWTEALLLSLD